MSSHYFAANQHTPVANVLVQLILLPVYWEVPNTCVELQAGWLVRAVIVTLFSAV